MQKVVLITGISSGFGKQTSTLLASRGHKVYGTIRTDTETDPSVHVLKMDLMDPESIKSAVASVIRIEGRIDVLINNAGMHSGGSIETIPVETIRKQMDTNVLGMVYMLKEVLPVMRKQGGAMIINFSSIGGLMGLPFQAFYSASKFAIEGISDALRMEVKAFNIRVVVINPGDFNTNNTLNRRNYIHSGENDPYESQFKKSLAIIEKDETGGWRPEKMAQKLVRIVESDHPHYRYVIASFEQKLAVCLHKILPEKLFIWILASHYGL